jgi:carboxyl-terminal processing protease
MKEFFVKHKSIIKKLGLVSMSLAVLGGVFFIGMEVGVSNAPAILKVTQLTNKETGAPGTVDFGPFWQAWSVLNEKYVATHVHKPVTDQDKVWGAIQGLAASLGDPYTTFFPPDENKSFNEQIAGKVNFGGVGMEIGIRDGVITVISPLKDSPSEKAGFRIGDKIVKIEATSTQNMKVEEAVNLIRGPKGTPVRITIFREGLKEPKVISVVRDTITVPVMNTELRSDGVFVIRLYSFSENSPELFNNAIKEFVNSKSDKLLLDLRGNPGGYLEAAVDMASWFLPAGKIVVQEEFHKGDSDTKKYTSTGKGVANSNLHFAILINGGSASASEILSGALSEHGVAKLIGEKSFGKGSVQELVQITDNPKTSLKVTIARWLTPKGHSISEEGLKPDIEVKMTADDAAAGKDPQLDRAVQYLKTGK